MRRARRGRGSARRGSTAGAKRGSASGRSSRSSPITATIDSKGDGRAFGSTASGGRAGGREARRGEHALAIVRDGRGGRVGGVGLARAGGGREVRGARRARVLARRRGSSAPRRGSVVATRGVRCERWVAAVAEADDGAIRVAACEGVACETWSEVAPPNLAPSLRVRNLDAPAAPNEPARSRWPAWATWTLAGVGVAGAAVGIVAAAAGVQVVSRGDALRERRPPGALLLSRWRARNFGGVLVRTLERGRT